MISSAWSIHSLENICPLALGLWFQNSPFMNLTLIILTPEIMLRQGRWWISLLYLVFSHKPFLHMFLVSKIWENVAKGTVQQIARLTLSFNMKFRLPTVVYWYSSKVQYSSVDTKLRKPYLCSIAPGDKLNYWPCHYTTISLRPGASIVVHIS